MSPLRLLLLVPALFLASGREATPDVGREITIVANDYAFAIPSVVPAGRTTFRFANHGKVRHELNITRLKHGVSVTQFLDTIRANRSVKPISEGPVGVLFAPPGGQSQSGLTATLTPGETYAVICILTDSAGAKRHYDLGMYSVINVGSAQPVAQGSRVPTDTIIATEYAFQYPRTLPPGIHTFAMRNDGKQRHELIFGLLRKGVSVAHAHDVDVANGDYAPLYEGDFGLLAVPGGRVPLGEITIDLLPDRDYMIGCFFQDTPQSPPHVAMGMWGSIHTSALPAH